jgi:hypothetical protein
MGRTYYISVNRYDKHAGSQNITQDFSPLQGAAKLVDPVCFVYLVDLVHLVSSVQPNKREQPAASEPA